MAVPARKSSPTMMIFFDTETTGLPLVRGVSALEKKGIWPDLVSLAWRIYNDKGELGKMVYSVVKPDGWKISAESTKIHGITTEYALEHGRPLADVIADFKADLAMVDTVVAHNMEFDKNVIFNACKWRLGIEPVWVSVAGSVAGGRAEGEICTMDKSKDELKIPNPYPKYGPYKSPSLSELYKDTFGTDFKGQHNSQNDVEAMCAIYWKRWGLGPPVA